jgi:hypothetical protein
MSQDDFRDASLRGEYGVRQESTANNGDGAAMTLRRRTLTWALLAAVLLSGCGEQKFEHAGSRNSLAENRQACAVEMAKSPAAQAYLQNPAAHRDYPSQAFANMIHCTERKGWKQVEAKRKSQPAGNADVSSRLDSTPRPIKEGYQSWTIQ